MARIDPFGDPEVEILRKLEISEQNQADKYTYGDVPAFCKMRSEKEKELITQELRKNKKFNDQVINCLAEKLIKQYDENRTLFMRLLSKEDEDSEDLARLILDNNPKSEAFIQLKKYFKNAAKIVRTFLSAYDQIKTQFPDFKNIHEGFKAILQLENIDFNVIQKMVEYESVLPEKKVFKFLPSSNYKRNSFNDKGFSERSRSLNLDEDILELEQKLKEQKSSNNLTEFKKHDLLLPQYLRLKNKESIDSIIISDTISTFLNLDPELKTKRCTGGNGIFKEQTYNYALSNNAFSRDINIIDLCFNKPNNKVAELITVDCVSATGSDYLLIETAEAGEDAFILPEYKGMPLWTVLLLEEVIDRAYKKKQNIFFSTRLDFKPETNMFVTTAVSLLNLANITPPPQKYKTRYREPLKWDEYLTTIRWKDNKQCKKLFLERRNSIKKQYAPPLTPFSQGGGIVDVETKIPRSYLGAWNSDYNFQLNFMTQLVKLFRLKDKVDDKKNNGRFVNFLRKHCDKNPKYPFSSSKGHANINNGRGFVEGFKHEVTEEKYYAFKKEMTALREESDLMKFSQKYEGNDFIVNYCE